MTKFIIFIFALQTIMFVPFSQALNDDGTPVEESDAPPATGKLPSTLCAFTGTSRNDITFKFSKDVIPIIPERCEVICYGHFRIDEATSETDIENMKSLTSEGYKIWTFVSYIGDVDWDVLMEESPKSAYQKQMESLTCFINDNRISGIILDKILLWYGKKSNFAGKINEFIYRLKEQCPDVLVGVVVSGSDYNNFGEDYYFDFEIANDGVDFYFIDTFTIGVKTCTEFTFSMGNLPLSANDTEGSDIISLDTLFSAVEKSNMDPSKKILNFKLETKTVDKCYSYTEYCCQVMSSSNIWCADPLPKCYKEGAAAKNQNYAGISITYLDFDDYDATCGCGRFPVTNAFIDGFQCADEPCCETIDTPRFEIIFLNTTIV